MFEGGLVHKTPEGQRSVKKCSALECEAAWLRWTRGEIAFVYRVFYRFVLVCARFHSPSSPVWHRRLEDVVLWDTWFDQGTERQYVGILN